MENKEKWFDLIPPSAAGNFTAIDTIGVPHPYCITPRHISSASDRHHGMLGREAIEDAEKLDKAKCGICKGKLSYSEHESALLINCKLDFKSREGEKELREYLLTIKDLATKNGQAGFAFKKDY